MPPLPRHHVIPPLPPRTVYDRALHLLGARAYATQELRQRLVRRGWPVPEVEAAIERLTAAGLLDDAAYARQLTQSQIAGDGAAPRRVRQQLARRGVDRGVADAAIDQVLADERLDTRVVLEAVARKRAATLAKSFARLAPQARRRRLYAFLARRGYNADDIRGVLDLVLKPADG
jgi:regulatory protein